METSTRGTDPVIDTHNTLRVERTTGEPELSEAGRDVLQSSKGDNVMRKILIEQFDHGYKVEIGCKTFAIEGRDRLIKLLTKYSNDPETVEAEYCKTGLLK